MPYKCSCFPGDTFDSIRGADESLLDAIKDD